MNFKLSTEAHSPMLLLATGRRARPALNMQTLNFARIHSKSKAGFSLAEMMVVIVIIGLLATMVVPAVLSRLATANTGVAKSDITAISGAITTYVVEHAGKYPERLEDLVTPDENGHKYLDQTAVPKDPWKNEYVYEPPQGGQGFKVICYGRDGQPGGEGEDADIDSISIKERK